MCGVGDVYQIDIPHLQPEACAPVSRHGGKKYCLVGEPWIGDYEFIKAATLVQKLRKGSVNNSGPSIPPWVAFVSGATW